jgi:hypothetical protein
MKKMKIEFYGDSEPSPRGWYKVLRYEDKDFGGERVIITDYTEAGMWVNDRTIDMLKKRGIPFKFEEKPLIDILKELPEDAEIRAGMSTYWEKYAEKKNLKTIKDLKKALGEE